MAYEMEKYPNLGWSKIAEGRQSYLYVFSLNLLAQVLEVKNKATEILKMPRGDGVLKPWDRQDIRTTYREHYTQKGSFY